MISIVISEKGGTERREQFEKPEITIGRVKGNDVLLSKGNVSKRHARLIERDGRFIVTDLKSTNGTYVNHRRITHAVIREGDRIYIGDFVLWVAAHEGDGALAPVDRPNAPVAEASALDVDSDSDPVSIPDIPFGELFPQPGGDGSGVVNHFPIEHDPDDSGPPVMGAAGSPDLSPRPGAAARAANGASSGEPTGSMPASTTGQHAVAVPDAEPTLARFSLPGDVAAEIRDRRASHQKWLCTFAERVDRALGASLGALDGSTQPNEETQSKVAAIVAAQLAEHRKTTGWPADLDPETLRKALLAELFAIGPLEALLADDATTQIRVIQGQSQITRRGRRQPVPGFDFTGDRAVGRALRRLCARSGNPITPDELHVHRQLEGGVALTAVRPPAAARGHMLVLNKLRRSDVSLDGLVRGGTISRAMATTLAHCAAARANLLVVGPVGSGTRRIVDALVASLPADHRTVWLVESGREALLAPTAAALEVGPTDAEQVAAVETAALLEPDHLVVPRLGSAGLLALVSAIGQGCEGVILHARAGSLRQGLDRLGAELAAAREGLAVETAREMLASAFDLGIEVSRVRDGRQRVCKLAELRATGRGPAVGDIFVFSVRRTANGETVEGSFHPTGVVPKVVEELAGRGVPLDTSIFRRHPTG